MRIRNKKDILPLICIQLAVFVLVLIFKPNHLITLSLVYFSPILFLLSKHKHEKFKLVVFSIIVSLFMFSVIDVLAVAGNSWQVQQTIPFRYLEYSYWENIIWSFGFGLFTILFYKHFSEADKNYKINKKWKIMGLILVLYNGLLYTAYFLNKELLMFDYAYLFIGTVTVVPFLIFFYIKNSKIFFKLILVSIYVGIFSLIYELVAVYIGNWWFPGKFIGLVSILGIKFPFEELVFWIVLTAPVLVAFYEFFIEDNR